jgi:hypothetical protein
MLEKNKFYTLLHYRTTGSSMQRLVSIAPLDAINFRCNIGVVAKINVMRFHLNRLRFADGGNLIFCKIYKFV